MTNWIVLERDGKNVCVLVNTGTAVRVVCAYLILSVNDDPPLQVFRLSTFRPTPY
ncbi:hypothetical protein FB451DRAFT_1394784 [Mycena latifolia]|nr:hypothetical protein FB451DRAFT_1394784 [Mycena latifolia]